MFPTIPCAWAGAMHPLKITVTSGGGNAVGSKFESVGHQFGRDNKETLTVIEAEPDRRFVFEASGSSGTFRHAFDLLPSDGGTLVRKSFEPVEVPPVGKLMMPIVQTFLVPKALSSDLKRIKAKVE